MGIKYPKRYPPKYYNPNWSPYSSKKISWDAHRKKSSNVSSQTKSNISSMSKLKTLKYTITIKDFYQYF